MGIANQSMTVEIFRSIFARLAQGAAL